VPVDLKARVSRQNLPAAPAQRFYAPPATARDVLRRMGPGRDSREQQWHIHTARMRNRARSSPVNRGKARVSARRRAWLSPRPARAHHPIRATAANSSAATALPRRPAMRRVSLDNRVATGADPAGRAPGARRSRSRGTRRSNLRSGRGRQIEEAARVIGRYSTADQTHAAASRKPGLWNSISARSKCTRPLLSADLLLIAGWFTRRSPAGSGPARLFYQSSGAFGLPRSASGLDGVSLLPRRGFARTHILRRRRAPFCRRRCPELVAFWRPAWVVRTRCSDDLVWPALRSFAQVRLCHGRLGRSRRTGPVSRSCAACRPRAAAHVQSRHLRRNRAAVGALPSRARSGWETRRAWTSADRKLRLE